MPTRLVVAKALADENWLRMPPAGEGHERASACHQLLGPQRAISAEVGKTMKTIQVFDKPMCCSSGVCGPQVDPVLPRFAADLEWLKGQGHSVERYNLAQQPAAFTQNQDVHQSLAKLGTDCLPLIIVDDHIVSRGQYPSREMLVMWTGPSSSQSLPVVQAENDCYNGSSCC